MTLEVKDLTVSSNEKIILNKVSLEVKPSELVVLMGPNGSGKSTLAQAIMGSPFYKINEGDILLDGESIIKLEPYERARMGLFLAFQNPVEIQGVSVLNLIKAAYGSISNMKVSVFKFKEQISPLVKLLNLEDSFLFKEVNVNMSGGEKKKSEILQFLALKPKYAILDEPDSGLDVDSLKVIANAINFALNNKVGILLITHYARILNELPSPNKVYVMVEGKIALSGGPEIVREIDRGGYGWIKKN